MLEVKFNAEPAQIGLLLLAVGAEGVGLTVTDVVPATLPQPLTVATTEYVPVASVVAAAIDGFCKVEEKVLGPVHAYVAPATVLAVRVSVEPAHIGLLLLTVGVVGIGLTVTLVVPALLVQPLTVTVTEYVPDARVVAAAIEGSCIAEEKVFGPVHAYVAPATVLDVRFKVAPAHNGLLLLAVGAAGIGLTVTVTVPAELVQPLTVAVTEYVPDASVVAAAIDGFCNVEEKLLGPVQL